MAPLLMPGVREKLMAWLDKVSGRPFTWGENDCALEVASWVNSSCGLDLGASWRGQYSDQAEADALLDPLGGLEAVMRAELAAAGLTEAQEPKYGDVGLVTLPGQDKPLAAVLMPSGRWRMRTERGILTTREAIVVVAWSLPCRPVPALHDA